MRHKFFLVLFGICMSFFFLECILRLAGYFYYNGWMGRGNNLIKREDEEFIGPLSKQVSPAEDKGLIGIICMGDSNTFGVGAKLGYSYPAQLQRMLDEGTPNRFRVYNCGIPGATSSRLLKSLPALLKTYKPHIVIVNVGVNDFSNPELSELVLLSNGSRRWYNNCEEALRNLRVYKVLKLGLQGAREKFKAKISSRGISDILKEINPESMRFCQIGTNLVHRGRVNSAQEYFKKAIDRDAFNEQAYLHLGHLYGATKEFDKALTLFEKLLKVNPYTSLRPELYRHLFWIYQHRDAPRNRIETLIRNIPFDEAFENPGVLFTIDQEKVLKNFKYNIRNMNELIRVNNAKMIFHTYLSSQTYLGIRTFDILKFLSEECSDIILVDNQKSLAGLSNIDVYFSKDDHPNENGYQFIAKNVYDAIKGIEDFD